MRTIDETYKMLALAPSRRIYCRAVFGTKSGGQWTDSRTYRENDYIISASIDIGAKSGGLEIGRAYCAKLTLRLFGGASVSQSDQVKIGVGFLGADGTVSKWVQLGVFYVDTVKKSDNIITITAYDRMLRAQKFYNSSLTYPCKMSDMLGEICGQMGITTVGGFALPIDPVVLRAPVKGQDSDGNTVLYTRREVLSYIASACAGNFFFNGDGQLDLTDFTAVSENMAAANSISAEISDETFTVSGVSWIDNGISHSRYDEDTSGLMEFENPLPFQSKPPILDYIDGKLTALAYNNATITRQGCGWYEPGDIVTAFRKDGTSASVLISGINYKIESGGFTEKIYSSALSENQSNYTTGDVTGQTVPQSVAQEEAANASGNSSALTEYEYLTDLSAKCNGVTYTVEKDDTTGLISKISDSNGNEFEPTINSGITDAAQHNAVFWAVAMCKGLGKKYYGNTNIFNISDVVDGTWKNSGDGYDIILPEGAEITDDGISIKVGNYQLPITGVLGDYTVFVVAKKRTDHTDSGWVSTIANYGDTPQFNICTRYLKWSIGAGGSAGVYLGNISASNYAVVAMRKSGVIGDFYVNQKKLNTYSGYATPISGYWDIGKEFWFKYIAILPGAMSDAEITAKIAELMTTYGI